MRQGEAGGIYRCPVCKLPLFPDGAGLHCAGNHRFDMAAQGYVNLLPAQKKKSRAPGDNKEMMAARTAFLQAGHYEPLSDFLNGRMNESLGLAPRILDAGCGEGYYAARLAASLEEAGKSAVLYGVDISKDAIKAAAKHCKASSFAVASLYSLPFPDRVFDAVYSIFSPLCPEEFKRVMRKNGVLVLVRAGREHLYGLKELLYEKPYYNEEKNPELTGFALAQREELCYPLSLKKEEDIQNLLKMTPYYYKTPPKAVEELLHLEHLETPIHFEILTYYIQ